MLDQILLCYQMYAHVQMLHCSMSCIKVKNEIKKNNVPIG